MSAEPLSGEIRFSARVGVPWAEPRTYHLEAAHDEAIEVSHPDPGDVVGHVEWGGGHTEELWRAHLLGDELDRFPCPLEALRAVIAAHERRREE